LDLEPSDELVSDYRGGLTALDGFDAFVTGKDARGKKSSAYGDSPVRRFPKPL
jgi:hypothetical protein